MTRVWPHWGKGGARMAGTGRLLHSLMSSTHSKPPITPVPQVVDCGANIGLFTLWATAQADLATVVAVEPMGPQFDCLQRNVELHMLQATVRARQLAVGGQSQESSTFVFFPRMPSSSHRAVYAAEKEGQREAMSAHRFDGATSTVCQTTTLSQLMADEGLDRIDLLKVDVEGDELAVLEGLTESDTRRVHQIVMEAHATDGRVERIVHLLEARGFEVRVGGGDPRMERAGCFNVAARRRSSSS
jgi:FkbM family methyltransferase